MTNGDIGYSLALELKKLERLHELASKAVSIADLRWLASLAHLRVTVIGWSLPEITGHPHAALRHHQDPDPQCLGRRLSLPTRHPRTGGAQHHAQGKHDCVRRRPPSVVGALQARGAGEPVARQARVRDVRQLQGAARRRAGEWLPALLR